MDDNELIDLIPIALSINEASKIIKVITDNTVSTILIKFYSPFRPSNEPK
jgi:hypothetical protein